MVGPRRHEFPRRSATRVRAVAAVIAVGTCGLALVACGSSPARAVRPHARATPAASVQPPTAAAGATTDPPATTSPSTTTTAAPPPTTTPPRPTTTTTSAPPGPAIGGPAHG